MERDVLLKVSVGEDEISKEIDNIMEEYERDKEDFWRLFEVFNNQFVEEYSNLPMRERVLDKHKEENKTRETILMYIGQYIDRNKSIETILYKKFIDN